MYWLDLCCHRFLCGHIGNNVAIHDWLLLSLLIKKKISTYKRMKYFIQGNIQKYEISWIDWYDRKISPLLIILSDIVRLIITVNENWIYHFIFGDQRLFETVNCEGWTLPLIFGIVVVLWLLTALTKGKHWRVILLSTT